MAIYSKICIMCSNEFKTMRISSVYCSKRCGNRSRSLPPQIRESLIRRNAPFTIVLDARPHHRIQDESGLLMALAKEEAIRRGINNEQYINSTDPANGDSTGFGIKIDQENNNDNERTRTTQSETISNMSEVQNSSEIFSTSQSKTPQGIRKIGRLK